MTRLALAIFFALGAWWTGTTLGEADVWKREVEVARGQAQAADDRAAAALGLALQCRDQLEDVTRRWQFLARTKEEPKRK